MNDEIRSRPAPVPAQAPASARGAFATFGLIVAMLAMSWITWGWFQSIGGADALVLRFGALAPLVSIPVHVLLSASPLPSEVIGVTNGAFYGLWLGTLYGAIGWWGGAALEYWLVRLGAKYVDTGYASSNLPAWLRRFPIAHPVFLIVGRQLPFGFDIVNVWAALAGVSPARHLSCAVVSNLLYAFAAAAIGAGVSTFR